MYENQKVHAMQKRHYLRSDLYDFSFFFFMVSVSHGVPTVDRNATVSQSSVRGGVPSVDRPVGRYIPTVSSTPRPANKGKQIPKYIVFPSVPGGVPGWVGSQWVGGVPHPAGCWDPPTRVPQSNFVNKAF